MNLKGWAIATCVCGIATLAFLWACMQTSKDARLRFDDLATYDAPVASNVMLEKGAVAEQDLRSIPLSRESFKKVDCFGKVYIHSVGYGPNGYILRLQGVCRPVPLVLYYEMTINSDVVNNRHGGEPIATDFTIQDRTIQVHYRNNAAGRWTWFGLFIFGAGVTSLGMGIAGRKTYLSIPT